MADLGAVLPRVDKTPEFYVYALLRESGTPFYIGKGKGRRWRDSKRKRAAIDVRKIAESLSESEAFELECFLIYEIGRAPYGPLVNRCAGGYGASGWKKSPELVEKMAAFHRGRKRPLATRSAISESSKGRMPSPASIEKQRRSLVGRKMPPDQVERLKAKLKGRPCAEGTRLAIIESNKRRRGIPWSPERRAKMMPICAERGLRQIGSKLSTEARRKIAAARTGSKASPEARAKMSAAQTGRKHSPETKAKISATHRARHRTDDKQWPLGL